MSLAGGALGYSLVLPTIEPGILAKIESLPPGKGLGSFVAADSTNNDITRTIRLFILGTFVFLLIYVWILLINILINVYFEITHPTTPTINQGLTNEDFMSAIYKQLTVCIIFTPLTFFVIYYLI